MKLNVYSLCYLSVGMISSTIYAEPPMFYIKNKHYGDIELDLKQKGTSVLGNKVKIKNGGELIRQRLDRNTHTDVEIGYYTCENAKKCKKDEMPMMYKKYTVTIMPSPKQQKTVYVKFKDGQIDPQVGIRGKTENGKYSLGNNINSQDDILR